MKKGYSLFFHFFICCALFLGISNKNFAQRIVNVSPGVGTLNEAVDGDTTATGERNEPPATYVLERDGLYLLNGTISNDGYHLIIKAADGDGARPILRPAVSSGGESSRCFDPNGDMTLTGLYISNKDELGSDQDRIFRVRTDSIRLYVDDCHLDYANQAAIRLDAKWTKIYLMNSIVSNIGSMVSPDNGRGVDDRGNEIDTLVFENCTFYNLTSRIIRDGGGIINYAKVDHCTIADIAQRGCSIGEAIEAYYTNNLVINNGFLGRTKDDTRAILDIAPLGSDLVQQGAHQVVVVNNNNFWIDPQLVAAQPDTIDEVTTFDSTTASLVDSFSTNDKSLNEEIAFTAAPALPTKVITDSWDVNVTEKTEMDQGTDPFGKTPFDFGYPNSAQSYTYSMSGQPLGDVTWFGMVVGVKDQPGSTLPENYRLFQNYPNPFNPTTTITYQISNASDVKLTVYNSLGQLVKTLVNTNQAAGNYSISWDGTNQAGSKVSSGIYFYRLNTPGFVSVMKMVMLK
jgi:FlgD Ig-like domain